MAVAVPSRLGADDGGADKRALFLKVFAGEVITAFEKATILKGLTRQRQIASGKSASFPAIYKASASYHTPGAEIVGQAIKHTEVIVTIDDLLIADAFIANIDEAMNHYDVRSQYSKELGEALAVRYDENVARMIWQAANTSAIFVGEANTGGSVLTDADANTNALSLAGSIWTAKQTMEEKDVPVERVQVNAALLPAQWYLLAQEPTLILNRDVDGDGSYSRGSFSLIGGVNVVKNNSLPWGTSTDASPPSEATKYAQVMTNTVACVFTEQAAATVQLLGLGMESEYDIRRQGTLMVSKYAVGHGYLQPNCAVEIQTA